MMGGKDNIKYEVARKDWLRMAGFSAYAKLYIVSRAVGKIGFAIIATGG